MAAPSLNLPKAEKVTVATDEAPILSQPGKQDAAVVEKKQGNGFLVSLAGNGGRQSQRVSDKGLTDED
jgi:hypothetical protein